MSALGCTKTFAQRYFLSPLLILGEGEGEGEVARSGLGYTFLTELPAFAEKSAQKYFRFRAGTGGRLTGIGNHARMAIP